MFASQYGQLEVVELLLKEGAKSNLRTKEGGSALLSAAQNGKSQCCKLLLTTPSSQSDVNECLNDGANGIFLSAQNNHLQTLKVLKKHGCLSGKARSDGTTPLWIAAQLGHDNIVQELLSYGEEDFEKANNGATALFKASQKGHEKVVKILLENKPNLGLLKNGETCLHAAALFGNLSIAKMLINAGSDPRLPNRFGETPLDLAIQMNYEEIVEFLKKAKSIHK
uniref:Ankyrin repeat domain-containing protein 29 n=1 Tax=Panagrolaimus sp. PS1159 TaxID=55785 RepID=A0AC35GT38_9BILA